MAKRVMENTNGKKEGGQAQIWMDRQFTGGYQKTKCWEQESLQENIKEDPDHT